MAILQRVKPVVVCIGITLLGGLLSGCAGPQAAGKKTGPLDVQEAVPGDVFQAGGTLAGVAENPAQNRLLTYFVVDDSSGAPNGRHFLFVTDGESGALYELRSFRDDPIHMAWWSTNDALHIDSRSGRYELALPPAGTAGKALPDGATITRVSNSRTNRSRDRSNVCALHGGCMMTPSVNPPKAYSRED